MDSPFCRARRKCAGSSRCSVAAGDTQDRRPADRLRHHLRHQVWADVAFMHPRFVVRTRRFAIASSVGPSRAYIRASLREKGAFANTPPKANRRFKPYFSTWLYRERNLIERFFSKLKHFRRVATRYDKLAENFLAMVQLASMRLWLRVY